VPTAKKKVRDLAAKAKTAVGKAKRRRRAKV
jgi:hypothetical protein